MCGRVQASKCVCDVCVVCVCAHVCACMRACTSNTGRSKPTRRRPGSWDALLLLVVVVVVLGLVVVVVIVVVVAVVVVVGVVVPVVPGVSTDTPLFSDVTLMFVCECVIVCSVSE